MSRRTVPDPAPIRLVATDLDGTLIRSDGTVSGYTADVLAELDRRDIRVVFVTGRPLRWARPVFPYVDSHGLAIVTNGAMVWDVAADRSLVQHTITGEMTMQVMDALRTAMPDLAFSVETAEGFSTEVFDQPVLKLLAKRDGADADAFLAEAIGLVGDLVEVTHSSFPLLEISAREVTKASTLAGLCDDLGIASHEVVAFGDMPNDLPMLRWAGRSFAIAGGHAEVLGCATDVAPGPDEDGVAKVLAGLMGLTDL